MGMDTAEVPAKDTVKVMVEATAITWAAMVTTWAVMVATWVAMAPEVVGNNQEHKGADFLSAPFI